jgi:putative oxidoreductase
MTIRRPTTVAHFAVRLLAGLSDSARFHYFSLLRRRVTAAVLIGLLGAGAASAAWAQQPSSPGTPPGSPSGWSFDVAPYLWLPTIRTTLNYNLPPSLERDRRPEPAEQAMPGTDPFLAFVARFCLVLVFPLSAMKRIVDYRSAMTQASQGWIPMPASLAAILLVLGGIPEIVRPICILTRYCRSQAALMFILSVVVTAVLIRNFWSLLFGGNGCNGTLWPFVKNIGLAGGFLFIPADTRMRPLSAAFLLNPFGPK